MKREIIEYVRFMGTFGNTETRYSGKTKTMYVPKYLFGVVNLKFGGQLLCKLDCF